MTENERQTTDSVRNRKSDRIHTGASGAKGEAASLAEKRAFLEKLKDSGFDSSFVFHDDNNE